MAGTITHFEIGKDFLNKTNLDINEDIFLLACQGHDLMYFIHFYELFKYKKNCLIVDYLQDYEFSKLVSSFEKELIKNENRDLKSFFYGYVVHHLIDSYFHPFIIYHSGEYLETKETKKYKGKHALMESVIDTLIADDINSIYKEIPRFKKNKTLEEKVEKIFNNVYKKENVGKTLVSNMQNVKNFLRIYRVDKTRIKRVGYLIVEKVTGKNVEFLSYNYPQRYREKIDLDKKVIWYNPLDNKKNYSSIREIYKTSLDRVIKVIGELDKCLNNKKEAKIDLNISAIHGYKENNPYKLKYFKF